MKRTWWPLALVALLAIGGLYMLRPREGPRPGSLEAYPDPVEAARNAPPPVVAPEVGALELAVAYRNNELAADAKFKDQVVRVAGFIGSVQRESAGEGFFFTLAPNPGSAGILRASFPASQERFAIDLKPDARVMVQCRIRGLAFSLVALDGCALK